MNKLKKLLMVLLTVCLISGSFAGTALAGGATGGGARYDYTVKEENGKSYLYDSNGKWVKKPGWVGQKALNTTMTDKYWSYIDKDGALCEGWKKIGGKWYYFNVKGGHLWSGGEGIFASQTGIMAQNLIVDNKYAVKQTGEMVVGWHKLISPYKSDLSQWVYGDASGKLAKNQWKKINGKWYYFGKTEKDYLPAQYMGWYEFRMITGWMKLKGSWYFLAKDGAMQTGWQKIGGKWYYFGTSGKMSTGWQKISGKWYYFGTDGKMVTGKQKIKGKTYTFNSKGAWVK